MAPLKVRVPPPCRVVWSLDTARLASCSDDRTLIVWDTSCLHCAESKRQQGSNGADTRLLTLRGHEARLWDAAIAARYIVTASEDCTVR